MEYQPLLPKLKEISSVNPDRAGKWLTDNANLLASLIESLKVSGTIDEVGAINSIPDMWARPLLFEMALYDQQNAKQRQFIPGLHKRVLGEWRGLLAMLALKGVKHLELSAMEVIVDMNQKNEFLATLAKLAPETGISKDTKWNRIYVLMYKGIPIAMTSPTTLVCSAADYTEIRLTEPWSRSKFIEDPIEQLTEEELKMLYAWLKYLAENIRKHPQIVSPRPLQYNSLLQRLEEYQEDIGSKLNELAEIPSSGAREHADDYQCTDANLHMTGIFRYLDCCIMPKPATVDDSHVYLVPSVGRKPAKAFLVFAKDIPDKWGVPASKLLLWPGLPATAIEYGVRSKSRDNTDGIQFSNAEYRYPDEFFHSRLVAIGLPHALPGAEPIEGADRIHRGNSTITPLLPLKRELLEYLTCEEIAERISFQDTQEGVLVRFRFPLSGVNGRKTDYVFEKLYPKDNLAVIGNAPVVEIWPEFCDPKWTKYFVYYKNHRRGGRLRQDLANNAVFAEPWAYEATSENIPEGGKSNRYIGYISKFPEALVCCANLPSQGNPHGSVLDAGIIILRQPETRLNYDHKWKIGIDFGTSGTMVYRKEDSKFPVPLSFTPLLFSVVDSPDVRTDLFLDFLPAAQECEESGTTGSFLSIFDLLGRQSTGNQLRPLLDGHIYLLKNYDDFSAKGSSIETNLKWQTTQEGRQKAVAYLKQVCLQCAAEAVHNGVLAVQWSFSYPTAFSRQDFESFRDTCQKAAEEACAISGLQQPGDITLETESVATALCFAQMGGYLGTFSRGAVCIDIGSGTSDISVWQGTPPKIIYQTSVRFAGRQLFQPLATPAANGKLPILDEGFKLVLTEHQQAEWLDMLKQSHDDKAPMFLDSVLRKAGHKMLESLPSQTSEAAVKHVLQNMTIGLSGLFYYVGLILRELHAQNLYSHGVMPNIYVAGNGSRIFDWIANGKLREDSVILRLIKHITQEAAGLEPENFTIMLSQVPKAEVAQGLVNEKPNFIYHDEDSLQRLYPEDNDAYFTYRPVIAGEKYWIEETERDWSAFINARDISKGVEIRSIDQLQQFFHTFNKFSRDAWTGKIKGGDAETLRSILDQVRQRYINERGKKEEDIRVEPVFIACLIQFLGRPQHG